MKPATVLTTALLAAIAVLHLARVIAGVPVTVGTFSVPMWASVLASVVPLGLVFGVWREHRPSRSAG